MSTILYLAYGSNLHPRRLSARVPSATFLFKAILPKRRLAFHKLGHDHSAKCDLISTESPSEYAYGAVFSMSMQEKPILDKIEGDGYKEETLSVTHHGVNYDCFTYVAKPDHIDASLKPYHWYKRLVLLGARYLDLPTYYLDMLSNTECINDELKERRITHEALIATIEKEFFHEN